MNRLPPAPPAALVAVLASGGTIASRLDVQDGLTAQDSAAQLVATIGTRRDLTIEAHDVLRVGSYLLTFAQMRDIAAHVAATLHRQDITGIVITHGTDTLEETSYLADLVHADARPVVFTGAQRTPDTAATDGPSNLADAVSVAASPNARSLGALIVFDKQVYAVPGTRKAHTLALGAFANDSGPIGRVENAAFIIYTDRPSRRFAPLALDRIDLTGVRVDIVSYYPGADLTALRAVVAAGANGIVLEATGAGNANPAFCAAVEDLTRHGIIVALTTRVPAGPVAAMYGTGGGSDLLRAGAIATGTLRAPQARILLTTLLAILRDPQSARDALTERLLATATPELRSRWCPNKK